MAFRVCVGAFVMLLVVSVVVSDDESVKFEQTKDLARKCFKETNTKPEHIRAFANKEAYPEAVKCLIKCFMTHGKALMDDGSFDVETIVKYTGGDKRDSITKCVAQVKGTDLCDRAESYELCFLAERTDYVKSALNLVLDAL